MPDAVWMEFKGGIDQGVYDQVNPKINPPGSPPEGLIFHCAGPSPDGNWRIIDVWDSRATFDRFFEEKIRPALVEILGEEALAQGEPPEISSWSVHSHNTGS